MTSALRLTAATCILVIAVACGPAGQTPAKQPTSGGAPPASNTPKPPNAADVNFMSGMIPHHAQAVIMAGWAPTHGARSDVRILCERIVVGQRG